MQNYYTDISASLAILLVIRSRHGYRLDNIYGYFFKYQTMAVTTPLARSFRITLHRYLFVCILPLVKVEYNCPHLL